MFVIKDRAGLYVSPPTATGYAHVFTRDPGLAFLFDSAEKAHAWAAEVNTETLLDNDYWQLVPLADELQHFASMSTDESGEGSGFEVENFTADEVAITPWSKTADVVNHPPHYTSHPSGVECITVTEHMNFNIGNAVKYLWRADDKGDPVENLKKARWYVERELQRRGAA